MPVSDFRVMNYGRGSGTHGWEVADVSIRDVGIPSRRIPTWDIFFRRSYEKATGFYCECTPIAPGAKPINCDHILAVVYQITRVKGPWEQDRVLMEKAWELVSGMKKEKPNFTVRRDENSPYGDESFMVYETGVGGVWIDKTINTAGVWAGVWYVCGCGKDGRDACDHIQAVMDFERNEVPQVLTRGPWASAGPDIKKEFSEIIKKAFFDEVKAGFMGIDPAAKDPDLSTYGSARGTYSDRDGTFRPEDLEKAKKILADKTKGMNIFVTATDEASLSAQSFIAAMKELDKALKTKTESEEPKEPDEPKKPRSRFSEIDL